MNKKRLNFDDSILDNVLNKIKKIIGIEKCNYTKNLKEMNDKLPVDITLKSVVILMTCVIKDGNNFHPQLVLEKH